VVACPSPGRSARGALRAARVSGPGGSSLALLARAPDGFTPAPPDWPQGPIRGFGARITWPHGPSERTQNLSFSPLPPDLPLL
jgi:hypothetical protein